MPTYIYGKEAFLKFVEKHLGEDTVILVSSDVIDLRLEKLESHVGLKEYFVVETALAADVLISKDLDKFDEKPKYMIAFLAEEELTEDARKSVRKT